MLRLEIKRTESDANNGDGSRRVEAATAAVHEGWVVPVMNY